jgi:Tol biopolymer transport system component
MGNGSFSAELTFSYNESEVTALGLSESELIVAYFDGGWHPMTTSVNTAGNTVSVMTDHFTLFAVGSEQALISDSSGSIRLPFKLHQNQPNPFNPSTTIRFSLDRAGAVTLDVYDVAGHLVRRLVDREISAGTWAEDWDGRDQAGREVASGAYFYRLRASGQTQTRKMVLLK